MAEEASETNALELATELTIAWLSNPNTRTSAEEVPGFLQKMHEAVQQMGTSQAREPSEPQAEFTPAVTARKSLSSKDHIISMIDGKPYKTLRRHLARHGLTPEQYRERFGLKPDYPMVSEKYSQIRRDMAKRIGLGRKPAGGGSDPAGAEASSGAAAPAAPAATPKRRGPRKEKPE
jgi:predicted transcriptional regulator